MQSCVCMHVEDAVAEAQCSFLRVWAWCLDCSGADGMLKTASLPDACDFTTHACHASGICTCVLKVLQVEVSICIVVIVACGLCGAQR